MDDRQRVFSGIQPSGTSHLGTYLGALKNWVAMQDDYDCFFCIVDLHALTVPQDPKVLRANVREMAAIYVAVGLDPEKSVIFRQSRVSEHTELAWLLNCVARVGELSRMTQFKDKAQKGGADSASVGLYDYPVLQAADVLLYNAHLVPVGRRPAPAPGAHADARAALQRALRRDLRGAGAHDPGRRGEGDGPRRPDEQDEQERAHPGRLRGAPGRAGRHTAQDPSRQDRLGLGGRRLPREARHNEPAQHLRRADGPLRPRDRGPVPRAGATATSRRTSARSSSRPSPPSGSARWNCWTTRGSSTTCWSPAPRGPARSPTPPCTTPGPGWAWTSGPEEGPGARTPVTTPALVLVPGLLCDERLWRHQAEGLADLAGRVLVPDVTGEDSVAAMARGILDAAPGRFSLAGLSMGGYVSLEVMRQAPERVEALALLDTSARPDTPEQTEARLGLVGLARAGRFDEVWRRLLPKVVHPDRVDEPEIRSAVREMAHAVGPEGFERQERAIIGRPDSRPDLPRHLLPDPRPVRTGRRPHAPAPARGASRRYTGGAPASDRPLRPPLDPRTSGGRHARHARLARSPRGPARGGGLKRGS